LKNSGGHSPSCREFRRGCVPGCAPAIGIMVEHNLIAIVDDAVRRILRCSTNGLRYTGMERRIRIPVLCTIVHDHDGHDP
jgi:hypothetical protein